MTTEENITIAEFVGGSYYGVLETGGNPLSARYSSSEIREYEKKGYKTQYGFTSWNGIMPVVSRVNTVFQESNKMYYFDKGSYILSFCGALMVDTDLSGVYDEIVKAIQWYNKNKP